MTMLSVIQTFCERAGLPSPSFVAGATNTQITQLQALLNECLEDICDRWSWEGLVKEATFTTVAAEDQGAIRTLAPSGFLSVLNETIYNRTLRLPVYGPLAAEKWQALKALPNSGPFYKYRIRGGRLLFNPTAVAGHLCAFEYKSSYAVLSSTSVEKSYATADDDTFVFEERLLQAALRWKWRSEKGLDYAEEFRRYEEMGANMAGRDGTKPVLSQAVGATEFQPGIFVPAGNWTVS
jgi:hypothetical protein